MGQRSRRRSRAQDTPEADARPDRAERDAHARATIEPLAPGERPRAILVASIVAAALGLGNLIAYAAGVEIRGQRPALAGVAGFTGLMLVTAVGTWRMRYWAVLGFQALLALIVLGFAISLVVVSSVKGLLVSLAVIGLGGLLFYKLIRSLARIQMPERPS